MSYVEVPQKLFSITNGRSILYICLGLTYCTFQVYSFESYKRSLPSLIGLKCETGIIDDCNLSLPEEVLPFSCKGIHMFADKTYNECGSQCKLFNKSNSVIKKGWTKYVRF